MLEGFGNKSIQNLLNGIEESKNNSLEKLLFGLGIRHVGAKMAKTLAKTFNNIDNIINKTFEELISINDIGEIIAQSVVDYFKDEENIKLINTLKNYHLNMNYLGKETKNDEFLNKTFVLTGSLEKLTREEATKIIEENGGKTSSSVSSKTYAVLVGKDPGSKYDKALKLNIPIWSEEEFLNKIKTN